MTLDLVIKILLSSTIGFIVLNSFFRYHFSSEKFITFAGIILIIVLFIFKNGENELVLGIIVISVLLITLIVKLIFDNKKEYGYFLLNINKEEYNVIKEEINKLADEFNINKESIVLEDKFPHLLCITKASKKSVKSLIKGLDDYISKTKKVFNMRVYWHLVIGLVLIAMIWRF